jgi:lipid A 3-O-deacylase
MRRLLPIFIFLFAACAAGAEDYNWMLLSGYGTTHPGLGGTEEHVETCDVVLRHSRKFKDTGTGWYRGSHNLLIEVPVHIVTNPDTRPMFGMNFLSSWTWEVWDGFRPYCFVGGGPVYTEAKIPGMGSNLNGNYQAGCGVYFKVCGGQTVAVEYRYHHISNASTVEPNDPLNSSKYLLGVSLRF